LLVFSYWLAELDPAAFIATSNNAEFGHQIARGVLQVPLPSLSLARFDTLLNGPQDFFRHIATSTPPQLLVGGQVISAGMDFESSWTHRPKFDLLALPESKRLYYCSGQTYSEVVAVFHNLHTSPPVELNDRLIPVISA
jgi:hypothetical protein